MAMLNFGLNRNSWNKSKAKNKNNYASLALVSLEQRVNPAPTVSISFNTNTGVLLLQSNALLNESSSYESFQSTGTLNQQKILNFSASPGFATTFISSTPNIFVDPLTDKSGFVQVDTKNLAGFSKIIFSGFILVFLTSFFLWLLHEKRSKADNVRAEILVSK